MKKIFIIFILGLTLGSAFGQVVQTNETKVKTIYPDTTEACNPKTIFTVVEIMPEYKGGFEQLETRLNENLTFGKEISGTIYINAIINCKDHAYAFQVLRGIDEQTDKKVIQELETLQNWTSGIHNSKPIDCQKIIGLKIKKGRISITNK